MSYDVFLINETKKEFVRTKTNGEDRDYLSFYIYQNQDETITIRGENHGDVEDMLYTAKGNEYKEIDLRTEYKPYWID